MANRACGDGARQGGGLIVLSDLGLNGAYVIVPERHVDERGAFARMYCRREYADHGIAFEPVQVSVSTNTRRGTVRGLHFQAPPRAEGKVVACVRGAVLDIAADLRTDSPTYGRWASVELTADGHAVYVPPGCAHGFQTLEDDTELLYLLSEFYDPSLQYGVRWDDPGLGIEWPEQPTVISQRDRSFPDFAW
jgi:dTDP-4-dehydrorhamnose 3,5-epimerase